MIVDVSGALKSPGTVFSVSLEEAFDSLEFMGCAYEFVTNVTLDADYVFTGSHVVFKGRFTASLWAECARCLKRLVYPVDISFEETFSKTDPESYELKGPAASLDRLVEDQIILNLPGRFLCREDCAGICPVCGADLNETPCGCRPQEAAKQSAAQDRTNE